MQCIAHSNPGDIVLTNHHLITSSQMYADIFGCGCAIGYSTNWEVGMSGLVIDSVIERILGELITWYT